MAAVPLPPYEPDVASLDASVLSVATNVFPQRNGYGPIGQPSPIASAMSDPCRGAISVQSVTYGFSTVFAGTSTKLYRLSPTGTWTNVTGGSSFGVSAGNYWSFAVYGDRLIATPTSGSTHAAPIDGSGNFAPLGGSPPTARFNAVIGEFLVLAGISSFPNALQWSDVGDIELWTPGSPGQSGDVQIMPDGGAITGLVGGEFGIVFQQRMIRRMIYNPGSATVFDFSVAEENRGCVSPSAVVAVGGQAFFLDREGFFVLRGAAATPIGAGRVNRIFADRVDASAIDNTVAMRDPTGSRVIFSYRSREANPDQPDTLDEAFIYDWSLDRWAFLKLDIQYGMPVSSPFTSIDTLGGNTDTLTKSFDSADYLGGVPGLGVFTADNVLSMLVGFPMEAVIAMSEAMIARPARAFVRGVRFDTDAPAWSARVGTRESLSQDEAVRWRDLAAPNAERYSPTRASGRYHTVELRIPSDDTWSYAAAVELDASPEGMR